MKPNHGTNKKVGKLSDRAYRVWVNGLVCQADDEGRLVVDLEELRVLIYAYQLDIQEIDIWDALAEIELAGLLDAIQKDGKVFGQLHDWDDHQKPSHPQPSTLPKIPEHSRAFQNEQERSCGKGKERKGRDRKGTERNGNKKRFAASGTPSKPKRAKKYPPEHFNLAKDHLLKTWKLKGGEYPFEGRDAGILGRLLNSYALPKTMALLDLYHDWPADSWVKRNLGLTLKGLKEELPKLMDDGRLIVIEKKYLTHGLEVNPENAGKVEALLGSLSKPIPHADHAGARREAERKAETLKEPV